MRVCKVEQLKAEELSPRKQKESPIYTCTGCKYESNRQYNVIRHENRIHWKQKLRICCGRQFFNKGDYYIHCEQQHPYSRTHSITSRTKYKITSDMVPVSQDFNLSFEPSSRSCDQPKQRFSERLRNKEMKSKVSLQYYSVTCNGDNIEDVPLISFFTDHRLKSYLKAWSSSKLIRRTETQRNEDSQTVEIALSEQNIETTKNCVENVRTITNSSVSSFSMELPTKKLILHRFRTNVKHEFEIPLRERNNNIREQVNFAEQLVKETSISAHQSRPKYSKRFSRVKKENVPKFAFSLEQQLDIRLDREIEVPLVSQLHRDFLASIDFDKYKIF